MRHGNANLSAGRSYDPDDAAHCLSVSVPAALFCNGTDDWRCERIKAADTGCAGTGMQGAAVCKETLRL